MHVTEWGEEGYGTVDWSEWMDAPRRHRDPTYDEHNVGVDMAVSHTRVAAGLEPRREEA
jgi:hypothetical protein